MGGGGGRDVSEGISRGRTVNFGFMWTCVWFVGLCPLPHPPPHSTPRLLRLELTSWLTHVRSCLTQFDLSCRLACCVPFCIFAVNLLWSTFCCEGHLPTPSKQEIKVAVLATKKNVCALKVKRKQEQKNETSFWRTSVLLKDLFSLKDLVLLGLVFYWRACSLVKDQCSVLFLNKFLNDQCFHW